MTVSGAHLTGVSPEKLPPCVERWTSVPRMHGRLVLSPTDYWLSVGSFIGFYTLT